MVLPIEAHDFVSFSAPCNSCGEMMKEWQTTDLDNMGDQVDYLTTRSFHTRCDNCGTLHTYERHNAQSIDDFQLIVGIGIDE